MVPTTRNANASAAALLFGRGVLLLALHATPAAHAHPSLLECGTDATTRLRRGATIMNKPVGVSGLLDGVVVGNTCFGGVMRYWSVQAPNGTYFAARVMGGGAIAEDGFANQVCGASSLNRLNTTHSKLY
jgi:hypothetical protein